MMPNRITRPEARALAEEEFVRFADAVAALRPDEWAMPTDCTQALVALADDCERRMAVALD